MKRRPFWLSTWTLVLAVSLLLGVEELHERIWGQSMLDPEIVAGLLGASAGILAILFQRRSEFVASLRSEWANCLDAIAAVRVLYARANPTEADYLQTFAKLSVAIDGMRAVYKNHGESASHIGYFPFSTLHDIRLFLLHDFAENPPPDAPGRRARLEEIDECWRLFRRKYLDELETPEADRPILRRRSRDKRKGGVSIWRRPFLRHGGKMLLARELDIEARKTPGAEPASD